MSDKSDKSFLQRYWWIGLVGFILLVIIIIVTVLLVAREGKKDEIHTQLPDETLMYPSQPEENPNAIISAEESISIPSEEIPSVPSEEVPFIPSEEISSVPSEEVQSVPSEELPSVLSEEISSISAEESKITLTNIPTKTTVPYSTSTPTPTDIRQSYRIAADPTPTVLDGKTYYHEPRAVPMPEYKFTLTDKQRFLDAHNYYRKRHCEGDAVWDSKLESLAQAWANKLAKTDYRTLGRGIISHPTQGTEPLTYLSTDGTNVNVGQNLAYGGETLGAGSIQYRKEPEDIVADWYEEMEIGNFQGSGMSFDGRKISFTPSLDDQKTYAAQRVKSYIDSNNLSSTCSTGIRYKFNESYVCSPGTGHFTQVVWKNSNRIGCASAPVEWENGSRIWVCNYAPAGNIMSNTEYKQNVIDPSTCGNE